MDDTLLLNDWMTSEEQPFFFKITDGDNDNISHAHTFYEIFYIIEGTISHCLNGKTEVLNPGDIVFLNTGDVHYFCREPGNTAKHRDIIIRASLFEQVCNFLSPDFLSIYNSNRFPKHISLPFERIESYERSISNMLFSSSGNFSLKHTAVKALCVSLLNCMIYEEANNVTQNYPIWFENLVSRFYTNEYLITGLDDILHPFHFDKAYICRTFKKYMGCTMTDYLKNIRLQKAAVMLQYSDDSVLSIAERVGFQSISYFNTAFKQKYSLSPVQFRHEQRKN